MNNHRLLTGLLSAFLLGGGVCAVAQSRQVFSMEELFEIAESNSVQLRPSVDAEEVARREISVANSQWLPDINASLSLSYIGNGFITRRDFSGYEKAPIPHLGTGLGLNVSQPVYTGGAIRNSIRMAELKLTASRYATELQRDNIRFTLAGFYLDIYKYGNLRDVVTGNLAQARMVLDEMKARYEQGLALQNDITRYELLVSDLELQLIKISNTLDILNNNLVVTAGLPANTVIVPDSTILSRALPS
ncbi:MAG: TolC family protein, partial [Muribaculaceae bacterium]|nr:TolC family protein [Muribaculaceae bacterium]